MLFQNLAIEALTYELPHERVSSSYIEAQIAPTMERLRVPRGMLESLTGIKERRFWAPGVMPSDVATSAARKVIQQANIDPNEIGCLVNVSVSKEYLEPSTASLVHGNLQLPSHCRNYDISNACLGFLDGICNIGLMIEAGLIKYGLIVSGENARPVVEATINRLQSPTATMQDFRGNFATLTIGSGAVAMLVCHKDVARSTHRVNGAVTLAASEYNRLCIGTSDQMTTDASALMAAGTKLAAVTWQLAEQTFEHWNDNEIAVYVPHQVSSRNMAAVSKTLSLNPEKLHLNFPGLGNIGSAALPITLSMADEDGRLNPGDQVGLLGIGSGLNCAMMSLIW
ncbi:3-oxoacyl-ACP synthase III [Anaerolineales bacterium HSG6]|nr:3-oxoacyl-ACP synthase III [Anaerolineales bacterium HSG6]MDM8530721.1 3-oxoacyl-ACP synthase III [Anaerolineales bacterium HSG25]